MIHVVTPLLSGDRTTGYFGRETRRRKTHRMLTIKEPACRMQL